MFSVNHERWMEDAVCRQVDAEAFHPEKGGDHWTPRRICDRCPVRLACLDFAMRVEQGTSTWVRSGIYGGMTANQRRKYEPVIVWRRKNNGVSIAVHVDDPHGDPIGAGAATANYRAWQRRQAGAA